VNLLPQSTVAGARQLLAAGWRPLGPIGRLAGPLGLQLTAAQYTDDWTWQAMAMMQLASEPSRIRDSGGQARHPGP
jgi:hypothetical protein